MTVLTNVLSSPQHGAELLLSNISPESLISRKLKMLSFEQTIIISLCLMVLTLMILSCMMARVLYHKTTEFSDSLLERERTLSHELRVDSRLERETLPRAKREIDLNDQQTLWIAPHRGLRYHRSQHCHQLKNAKEARMISPCSCMIGGKGQ